MTRADALVLLILVLGLVTAGCEDPSNVGLGLIGESGGDPVRMRIPATELPAEFEPPPTLNVRSSLGYVSGATRVLAGTVEDPLFGTITTKGYIDVSPTTSQSADYRSGTITSVELELTRIYVYGDTVATISLVVSGMDEAWPATTLTSDTSLTAGAEITRVDFSYASDTTIVIDLPQEWYSAHSATLLSSNVLDDFHGFQLSTANTSTVVGFDAGSGRLRIVTTTGTAELLVSKIFTHVERIGEATPPPGTAFIQDGTGQNLSLDFDFQADSISGTAVSRAVVELAVDRASMDAVPQDFFRPAVTQFDFMGVREDGTTFLLRSAILGEDDTIRFVSNTAAAGQPTIVRTIQRAAAGNEEFTRYRVRLADVQAAINSVLVFAPGPDEKAPHAVLTLTPTVF